MSMPVVAYFDGLCYPHNPGGYACGGWYILPHPGAPTLLDGLEGGNFYCKGDEATNNVAEYEAALDTLRAIYRTGYRGAVVLRGDSKLVIEQVNGRRRVKTPHIQSRCIKLQHALTFFQSVTVEWVPREQNAAADEQSRCAYKRAVHGEVMEALLPSPSLALPLRLPGC